MSSSPERQFIDVFIGYCSKAQHDCNKCGSVAAVCHKISDKLPRDWSVKDIHNFANKK